MASDPPKDSFAALFEETGKAAPRRQAPRVGDTLDVVVVQVGKSDDARASSRRSIFARQTER
jgi:hypothetical protein